MTNKPQDKYKVSQISHSARCMASEMIMIGFEGTRYSPKLGSWLKNLRPGGIILFSHNIENSRQTIALVSDLKKLLEDVSGLPPFISVDQEGGRVTRIPSDFRHCAIKDEYHDAKLWPHSFPSLRSIGKDGSEELCERTHEYMACALSYLGFNIDYAPVLDIDTNPINQVISDRSFGSNVEKVCSLGRAAIRGLKTGGMMTCAKHFPGHGNTEQDSHFVLPIDVRTKERLIKYELTPFKMAISMDVEFFMTAHVLYPELDKDYPATLSPKIIRSLLRKELSYEGVIVTDDLDMKAISESRTDKEIVELCLASDIDQFLICRNPLRMTNVRNTLELMIDNGQVEEKESLIKLNRLLHLKSLAEQRG